MNSQELIAKLGFRVSKTKLNSIGGRPPEERILIHKKNGVFVGDNSHWAMWELLAAGNNDGA